MFKLINDDMRPGVQILAREIQDGKVIPCVCPYRNGHVMPAQEFTDPISNERIIRPPKLIEAYCGTNCPHFNIHTKDEDGIYEVMTCKHLIDLENGLFIDVEQTEKRRVILGKAVSGH